MTEYSPLSEQEAFKESLRVKYFARRLFLELRNEIKAEIENRLPKILEHRRNKYKQLGEFEGLDEVDKKVIKIAESIMPGFEKAMKDFNEKNHPDTSLTPEIYEAAQRYLDFLRKKDAKLLTKLFNKVRLKMLDILVQ